MPTRLRPLLIALPVLALLAVPGAALAAKTKTTVEPAQTTGFVKVRGTNGWTVQITAGASGSRPAHRHVAVYAKGPQHAEVDYLRFPSRFTKDGTIEAMLPGVGHIDLRYEPTEHHRIDFSNGPGCTGAPSAIGSNGVFRGTIELHVANGLTTVDAHSARGELWPHPKVTCQAPVRSKAQIKREVEAASAREGAGFESLSASRKLAGGTLSFNATSFPIQLRGNPPRLVDFTATYSRQLDGMFFTASANAEVKNAEGLALSLSPLTGTPSEATVEPPAPFLGSANFTLESPTVADWIGDLRVPIPTLGTVALAGPQFRSTLCGSGGCTDTAPGTHVAISVGGKFTGNFFPG
jgi:hypothetical protein